MYLWPPSIAKAIVKAITRTIFVVAPVVRIDAVASVATAKDP